MRPTNCKCARIQGKANALHLSVSPVLSWDWSAQDLHRLHWIRLRMTRHVCHWWPQPEEAWRDDNRRTATWAERVWAQASMPSWITAVAALWWRWGGHVARNPRDADTRWVNDATDWKDAWWRRRVTAVHESQGGRERKRSWGETSCSRLGMPRQQAAQGRDVWRIVALDFARLVLRITQNV